MGIVIPLSVETLEWGKAKEVFEALEVTTKSALPPQRVVNRFIQESAEKVVGEVKTLFAGIQEVSLPQRHSLEQHIKDFKHALHAHFIGPTDLPKVQKGVSEELPVGKKTPIEDPVIARHLLEAPAKLSFARTLISRLPQTLFHRHNRSLAKTVEDLTQQCQELVTFRTYVGEVREVQKCIATIKDIDAQREALIEQMKPLQGIEEERALILSIREKYSQLFREFDQLQKEVARVHAEYPTLFITDLQQLHTTLTHDHKHLLLPLLAGSASTPFASVAKHIRETLNRITFSDLLDPSSLDYRYLRSLALDFDRARDQSFYPEEFKIAWNITEVVCAFRTVHKAIKEGTLLTITRATATYLSALNEEHIAPLRDLFASVALPFIEGRTPPMQRRLIEHMHTIFSICPLLLSDATQATFDEMEKRLAPPAPKEYHSTHEKEYLESLSLEIQSYYLSRLEEAIQKNNFSRVSQNDLRVIREGCRPNSRAFETLIQKTLSSNLLKYQCGLMSPEELATFIGSIQNMIESLPSFDALAKIRDALCHILENHKTVAACLAAHPVSIPWVIQPCSKCIQYKLDNDEWEELLPSEVQKFRNPLSKEHAALAAKLQHTLDTSSRSELAQWKEDFFDPFLKVHDLNVDCVTAFLDEVSFRLSPPSFWAWIQVLFKELLRLLCCKSGSADTLTH